MQAPRISAAGLEPEQRTQAKMSLFARLVPAPFLSLVVMLNTGAAGADSLRMLTSWDSTYLPTVHMAQRYADELKRASDGGLFVIVSGPETVPPFEQFQPIQVGLFDLLFTHGAYHSGNTGIGMALDAIEADPASRRESGIWDETDRHYQRHGLKLIALPTNPEGYQIILREPVGGGGGLEGRKIRGTPVYHAFLESLGASPVVLPGNQIYTSLEKGVIDGAAWPVIGALDFHWYEVADYLLRPSFGNTTHLLLFNLDKWNGLPADQQKILLDVGRDLERDAYERFKTLSRREETSLAAKGMQFTRLGEAQRTRVPQTWADGVWRIVVDKNGAVGEALRAFARDKGMTR
jgi:TRAP-type mannitol/chloroaromatic compound transport system substrate-binding protein